MSRDLQPASLVRCAVVWLVATAALVGLAWWVLPDLRSGYALVSGGLAGRPFDEALVWVCEVALLVAAGWLWLVTGLVAHDAAHGVCRRRRGVPHGLRRLVLVACGAALVGGLTAPTYAATPAHQPDETDPTVLSGLPLPDRASAARHVGRVLARQVAATERPAPDTVVVQPGDTLWDIADQRLAPGAPASEIAEDWQRIYRSNRSVIGADPNLIVPAQRLRLPRSPEEH